ncbi:MAG: 50S ribosomal protein L9 [Oscillospiraceae bacterium]|nr:50S ribosomal protein L9 [Oscillospiraceae bacterium]
MKIILLEDVKGSGKKDQLLNVSDGYAKNFLIPRKLAVKASKQALNELEANKESKQRKLKEEEERANDISKQLEKKVLNFYSKPGKDGKIFGSITSRDIAKELKKVYDFNIDKRKIIIPKDMKVFGTYECKVKLFHGVSVKIYININESNTEL